MVINRILLLVRLFSLAKEKVREVNTQHTRLGVRRWAHQAKQFSWSPPHTVSSLLFCTGIQFSCDSIHVFNETRKWRALNVLFFCKPKAKPLDIMISNYLVAFFQMMNGLRKFEVKYSGDPELQPICSFENPALVRLFYKFSTHLNEKVVL